MKKLIFLLVLCMTLTGCFPPSRPAMPGTDGPVPAQSEPATQTPTETIAPAESPEPPASVSYTLYLPNENANGFVTQNVETDRITADGILLELQKAGALPDTVILNAFGSQDDQLILDFNSAFADAVDAMGTSGEYMIIGSLVNTFLNAFQAHSLTFTVEGQILESGHVIYDFPLTYFE